jgi:hypothetical protein
MVAVLIAARCAGHQRTVEQSRSTGVIAMTNRSLFGCSLASIVTVFMLATPAAAQYGERSHGYYGDDYGPRRHHDDDYYHPHYRPYSPYVCVEGMYGCRPGVTVYPPGRDRYGDEWGSHRRPSRDDYGDRRPNRHGDDAYGGRRPGGGTDGGERRTSGGEKPWDMEGRPPTKEEWNAPGGGYGGGTMENPRR